MASPTPRDAPVRQEGDRLGGQIMSNPNSMDNMVPDDTHWGLTHTKLLECSYTWIIDNFEYCCAEMALSESSIISPTFSAKANNSIQWRLRMKRKIQSSGDYFTLALELVSHHTLVPKACYQFSLLNETGRATKASEVLYYQQSGYNRHVETDITFIHKNTLLSKKNELLPRGMMTIRCKVSVFHERIDIRGRDSAEPKAKEDVRNEIRRVSDDICKLYDDMTLSDVTLIAGGKEIRAHKLILAARSTVLAAMFQHDMQEQKLSRVDIIDINYDTLTEVLRFIYTDRVQNLDKMAADLLVAADKYALDGLEAMCVEPLCKSLSVENAADLLVLADLHSVVRLKAQAIAFINLHAKKMKETTGWNNIINSHPHLVAELFLALTDRVQQQ